MASRYMDRLGAMAVYVRIPAVFVMFNFCYLIFAVRGWSLEKVCKLSAKKEA